MLTTQGHVKVMDFGLAQWMPEPIADVSKAQTVMRAVTEWGVYGWARRLTCHRSRRLTPSLMNGRTSFLSESLLYQLLLPGRIRSRVELRVRPCGPLSARAHRRCGDRSPMRPMPSRFWSADCWRRSRQIAISRFVM